MKFILLTLPLVAMATMTITTNEHVATKLTPDILHGSLSFEEQNKNANLIKENLNAIIVQVKKFDPNAQQCHGGGYQISPQYTYTDQKQVFSGYSGSLFFACEFSNITQYNALLEKINPVMAQNVRKNEGSLSWEVSEQQALTTQRALRNALLQTAYSQAQAFSKTTALSCDVTSVNFGGDGIPMPEPMMTMSKSINFSKSAVSTQSPLQHDQKTSLDAAVTYSCTKP